MENQAMLYFKLFRDVCRKINSSLNFREVLSMMTETIVKTLNIKGSSIFLLDKEKKLLKISAFYGLSEAYVNKGPIDAEKSIMDTLKGEPILVLDAENDSRIQYPQEAKREGISSILSIPMSVKGKVIGVLRIYCSEQRKFTEIENEFISGIADIGSLMIVNARMYCHLKDDYESLMNDAHRWFDFGRTP